MAVHIENNLIYYICIDSKYVEWVASLRCYNELMVGIDGRDLWIRNLSKDILNSYECKSIPFKDEFYLKDSKLFKVGSILPAKNLPNILWTPIQRAIGLKLPKLNFNFFSLDQTLINEWIEFDDEAESQVLRVSIEKLENYIKYAPKVRLDGLRWTIIDSFAFIIGHPMLPLDGKVYRIENGCIFPIGKKLKYNSLLSSYRKNWNLIKELVLWEKNQDPILINLDQFTELSRSSFVLTKRALKENIE